jgi:hypothetical protein
MEQTITLANARGEGKPSPRPVGRLLTEVPDLLRQCVSMAFRGRSKSRGGPPRWLANASDIRLLHVEPNGTTTTIVFEVPPLGLAAPELFEQGVFEGPDWPTRPERDDTGFDLLGDLLLDVTRRDENSERFDAGMLDGLKSLRTVVDGAFRELHINSRRYPDTSPAVATSTTIDNARLLYDKTPAPRQIRLVGNLDAVRISTGSFALRLDDGHEVKGAVETDQIDGLLELMKSRQRTLVRGEAVFKPSGQLLLVAAEGIESGVGEPGLFSRLPTFAASTSLAQRAHRPQTRKRGLAAIVGQWPGDETDEEIAEALRGLRE